MPTRPQTAFSRAVSRCNAKRTRYRLWSFAAGIGALSIAIGSSRAWAQTNLGLAATQIAAAGQKVVFLADERAQEGSAGGCEFNGDGGCVDQVPYVYDTVAGTTTHLQFAARTFKVAGNFAAFAISESASGKQDLNGDAGVGDVVLFVYDLTTATGGTATPTNTGQALGNYEMDDQHVIFTTREKAQHADLNSDGDTTDKVLQTWNLSTSGLSNTGLAGEVFSFAGDWVAVHVSEKQQNKTI